MKIMNKMLLGLSTICLSISTFGKQVSLEESLGNNIYAIRSVSSGNYLDGRDGQEDPLMTNRDPAGDKFLQWVIQRIDPAAALGIYAIKSVSSGKYLDGRDGQENPVMTDRNPVGDKFLQWQIQPTGYMRYAIKSISSGNYLDGRGGEKDPIMTFRNPVNDEYLQWEFEETVR